jgi:hypothetical protein
MTVIEEGAKPWADPNHESYRVSRRKGQHRCLGCRKEVPYSAWGPLCHPCNVARMTGINASMAQLARSIGDEEAAKELEAD